METAKLENWTFLKNAEFIIFSQRRASKGLLRGSRSHLLPSLMQLSGKLLNIMSTVLILNVSMFNVVFLYTQDIHNFIV